MFVDYGQVIYCSQICNNKQNDKENQQLQSWLSDSDDQYYRNKIKQDENEILGCFYDGTEKLVFNCKLIDLNNCTIKDCKVMLINDIITNVMGYLNDFYNNDNGIEKEEKYRYCNLEIRDLAVYKEFLDKYCFTQNTTIQKQIPQQYKSDFVTKLFIQHNNMIIYICNKNDEIQIVDYYWGGHVENACPPQQIIIKNVLRKQIIFAQKEQIGIIDHHISCSYNPCDVVFIKPVHYEKDAQIMFNDFQIKFQFFTIEINNGNQMTFILVNYNYIQMYDKVDYNISQKLFLQARTMRYQKQKNDILEVRSLFDHIKNKLEQNVCFVHNDNQYFNDKLIENTQYFSLQTNYLLDTQPQNSNLIITYVHDQNMAQYICFDVNYDTKFLDNTSYYLYQFDYNQLIIDQKNNLQMVYINFDINYKLKFKQRYFILIDNKNDDNYDDYLKMIEQYQKQDSQQNYEVQFVVDSPYCEQIRSVYFFTKIMLKGANSSKYCFYEYMLGQLKKYGQDITIKFVLYCGDKQMCLTPLYKTNFKEIEEYCRLQKIDHQNQLQCLKEIKENMISKNQCLKTYQSNIQKKMREEEAKYVSSQIANKESSQIDQINKQIENQIVKTQKQVDDLQNEINVFIKQNYKNIDKINENQVLYGVNKMNKFLISQIIENTTNGIQTPLLDQSLQSIKKIRVLVTIPNINYYSVLNDYHRDRCYCEQFCIYHSDVFNISNMTMQYVIFPGIFNGQQQIFMFGELHNFQYQEANSVQQKKQLYYNYEDRQYQFYYQQQYSEIRDELNQAKTLEQQFKSKKLLYYINLYTNIIFKMLLYCSKNLISDITCESKIQDTEESPIAYISDNKYLDVKYCVDRGNEQFYDVYSNFSYLVDQFTKHNKTYDKMKNGHYFFEEDSQAKRVLHASIWFYVILDTQSLIKDMQVIIKSFNIQKNDENNQYNKQLYNIFQFYKYMTYFNFQLRK